MRSTTFTWSHVPFCVILFLDLQQHIVGGNTMSEEKTTHSKLSEARRRANKKYNDRFVEIKVRVTPEKRSIIKEHAEAMGESATAFINRAIDEAMKRDLSE